MSRKQNSRARQAAHFPTFDLDAPAPIAPVEMSAAALTPFQTMVKRLALAYGPAGSEETVREVVRAELKGLADQVRVDALGNLIALRKGSGNGRKKIMLTAPLDEIGVMVKFIEARGFARFGLLGAVKPLTLLGARCQFENGVTGIFGREPQGAKRTEIDVDALFIDLGARDADHAPVQVGDAACFVGTFHAADELWMGKALGGRASCAVLIETLRRLKKCAHDVYCVFSAQHQVGARGAGAAAFAIQPDNAFVLEPTPAHDIPGAEASPIALGKGSAILMHDENFVVSSTARQLLLSVARGAQLPYQIQARAHAGGGGASIQATRQGIITAALALPTRYLNTPSEMIHARDVETAIEIFGALLASKAL